MNPKQYCPYDKTRICNDSCVAFEEVQESLHPELVFDPSSVVPSFCWKNTLLIAGPWCNRLGAHVGKTTTLKTIKDGKVIDE